MSHKKKKKQIKTSSAKAKGRRLQNWTAKQIASLLGMSCGKDEHIAPREMGQCGCDIRLVGEAKKFFPFSVECKAQEAWNVHGWVKQAQSNVEKGSTWLLVCKRSRERPLIVMDAEDFFSLLYTLDVDLLHTLNWKEEQ